MRAESGMGVRVKFHKDAWWVFINHRGKRHAKKIGDRETAMRVARAIRERIALGDLRLPAAEEQRLDAYARTWVDAVRQPEGEHGRLLSP